MSKTGTSIAYTYGVDGQRISKSVTASGVTTATEYYYRDGQLIEMISGSDRLHFFYNANGTPISVLYNNTRYYYVRNAQGDIVALTTVTGQKAVTYTYDAWGKLLQIGGGLASTLGQANPLRYRGYVYDSETGLYYLGSRYYDPAVGRFINADKYLPVLFEENECYNLFIYCYNNPLNWTDSEGDIPHFYSNEFPYPVLFVSAESDPNDVIIRGGHNKRGSISPHNKNKHQEGEARRRRDQIGEKGDKRREEDRSNKRRSSVSTNNNRSIIVTGIVALGSLTGITIILADDATLVGILDDGKIFPLIEIFIECMKDIFG